MLIKYWEIDRKVPKKNYVLVENCPSNNLKIKFKKYTTIHRLQIDHYINAKTLEAVDMIKMSRLLP